VTAWKAEAGDVAAFNSVLTANNVKPITVEPTRLAPATCAFAQVLK